VTKFDDLARRACDTYYFHAAIGMHVLTQSFCSSLKDADRPHVWDLNRIFEITAQTAQEIDQTVAFAEARIQALGYTYISTSPFTSPAVIARLAFDDFQEETPVIQMVLQAPLKASHSAGNRLHPVASDADWKTLYELVLTDHSEGARTRGKKVAAHVTRGMVDGYRRKTGPCQFFLVSIDDTPCAYGSATISPNGMGMVEDMFTLPAFRRRGLASALISDCVDHLRQNGCADILIGSLATEPPKALYQKLGFQPVCVTRSFMKRKS
jgi:GNAT superfamily N-acetyltransferase